MIEIEIPDQPYFNGVYVEPVNPDYKHIAQACWLYCTIHANLRSAGFKIKQVETSDVESLFSGANTQIQGALDDIDNLYDD